MRGIKSIFLVLSLTALIADVGSGQQKGSPEAFRAINNAVRQGQAATERRNKAGAAGVTLFGVDERVTAETAEKFQGTVNAKTPTEFQVGDWGYTSHIFEVLDVVGEKELLAVPIYKDAEVMLIRGLSTDKVTDGVEFILQHPFTIDETYKYETVIGGQRTALVLDVSKFNDRMEKERVAAEEALFQPWVIDDKEVVAKFIDYVKGKVTLERKDDGSIVEIAFSKLKKADQERVREEKKSRGAQEKSTKEKAKKGKQP